MMKILLDPQIFNEQKFGGISRYYAEIFSEFKKDETVKIDFPGLSIENIHFKESDLYKSSFQNRNSFFINNSKIFRGFREKKLKRKEPKLFIKKLIKQDFDLFIPTYYDTNFLEYIGNKPFVLTVYDMIHELFQEYFHPDKITVPYKKLLMERATRIIAISESTKNDILKFYPHIPASKIDIVYLSYTLKEGMNNNLSLPQRYILFIGNRSFYKNFVFFFKSVALLLKQSSDLYLVCAGGNEFTEEEHQLIGQYELKEKVIQQNFTDADLAFYYRNAQCFVFPSQYEGFGIPVLESMACGCPVVLSNHSSFPEVAGNAGVYFEQDNAKDLQDKVTMLLNDEVVRQDYIAKGLKQAKNFTWKKTAIECLAVYKKAIECKK